jgi:hypothetical protein
MWKYKSYKEQREEIRELKNLVKDLHFQIKLLQKWKKKQTNIKNFESMVIFFMQNKEETSNIKDFTIYDLWVYVHKFYSLIK